MYRIKKLGMRLSLWLDVLCNTWDDHDVHIFRTLALVTPSQVKTYVISERETVTMTSKSIAFVHMVEGMSIKNSVLLFSYQHRTTILLCESSAVSMFCKVLLLCFLLSSVLITCTFQSSWFALPLFQLPHEVNGSQSISPEAFMTTVRIVVIVLRIVHCENRA